MCASGTKRCIKGNNSQVVNHQPDNDNGMYILSYNSNGECVSIDSTGDPKKVGVISERNCRRVNIENEANSTEIHQANEHHVEDTTKRKHQRSPNYKNHKVSKLGNWRCWKKRPDSPPSQVINNSNPIISISNASKETMIYCHHL